MSEELLTRELRGRLISDRLDWNLLRSFIVITHERSLSRAAARLHLTQSAISQALKRLETQLGRDLVYRDSHRFELTEAGEATFRIAQELYATISGLDAAMAEAQQDVAGRVRLVTVSTVQDPAYDAFLAAFHVRHPRVELELDVVASADIASILLQQTATAALGIGRQNHPRLVEKILLRQSYIHVCGPAHRLFGQGPLSLEALRNEGFVSFFADRLGGALFPLTLFRAQHGLTGRFTAASSSVEEIIRLVKAGYGVGCLPAHMVEQEIKRGHLWQLPPYEGISGIDIYLIWNREHQLSAAERAFMDEFRASLANR